MQLQQSLPFTVLKPCFFNFFTTLSRLQQSLPFTVLKHASTTERMIIINISRCNSPYRLRY